VDRCARFVLGGNMLPASATSPAPIDSANTIDPHLKPREGPAMQAV
jgi:hypothetical protein